MSTRNHENGNDEIIDFPYLFVGFSINTSSQSASVTEQYRLSGKLWLSIHILSDTTLFI